MTEYEYRIKKLNILFDDNKGKKIALYGTGASVNMIIDEFPDLHIVGLMDAKKEGGYFRGYYVLSEIEAVLAGIQVLVIPARFDSAIAVFKRMILFCHAHSIKMLDIYGNDMERLNGILTDHLCGYAGRTNDDLWNEICRHDTIGFSLKDTLLYGSMKRLLPRTPMVDLLNKAAEAGKGILILDDLGLKDEDCRKLFNQSEIKAECKFINKHINGPTVYDGLFRQYLNASEGSVLHIGCDYVKDGYVPLAYGIDSFLIKSYYELFGMAYPDLLDGLAVNDYAEELIYGIDPDVFEDPFRMFENKGRIYPTPCDNLKKLIMQSEDFVRESSCIDLSNPNKKNILITFPRVPHFDVFGADRTAYTYLKLFAKMGMNVILLPSDFNGDDEYIKYMDELGIEVLTGDYFRENWIKWLMVYGDSLDYVFLQLIYDTKIQYEPVRKYCTRAKILYFEYDLVFLRKEREYGITGEEYLKKEAQDYKQTEIRLMGSADVSYLPGEYERDYMRRLLPGKNIKNIPVYVYEELLTDIPRDFRNRKDIMIVANVDFEQNLDGIVWFKKAVFPKIREKFPEIIWHIVGKASDENRKKIESNGIVLHGYLSDEDLKKLYNGCRMEIVPLRFGSGVKGKIIEAAYNGLPVVTTPVGAEAIDMEAGNIAIGDGEEELADVIIRLYENYEELERMSKSAAKFIEENYMFDVAERVFREDIEI